MPRSNVRVEFVRPHRGAPTHLRTGSLTLIGPMTAVTAALFCAHRRGGGWRRSSGADGGSDFEEEFEEEERALQSCGGARAWSLDDGPFKLVLIVNMQLKMGKGKVRVCVQAPLYRSTGLHHGVRTERARHGMFRAESRV